MLKATLGEEEGKAWFDVHLDLGKIDAGGGNASLRHVPVHMPESNRQ